MTTLPVALSLSSSFTQIGAIAAFAALLGIAILALLLFSQARELKRLREWAGRAPERSAELEQRVSAEAVARVGQPVPPVPPVRQVPRTTPVVARPAAATAGGPATRVVGGVPGETTAEADAVTPLPPPASTGQAPRAPAGAAPVSAGQAAPGALGGSVPLAAGQAAPGIAAQTGPAAAGQRSASSAAPGEGNRPGTPGAGPPATPAGAASPSTRLTQSDDEPSREGWDAVRSTSPTTQHSPSGAPQIGAGDQSEGVAAPPTSNAPIAAGPATAAAAARMAGPASATPRAPTPAPGASAPAGALAAPGESVSPSPAPPRRAPSTSRPPAPTDQRRGTPEAATTAGTGAASRQAERLSAESRARRPDPKRGSSRAGGSPARATIAIVAGVIVVVVALVLVFSSGGGGKSTGQGSAATQGAAQTVSTTTATHAVTRTSVRHTPATVASPASITVAVLNGTNTTGLAHSLSDDLQQSGYLRAAALNGSPPGSHTTTTVEYANGHKAEAQGVAHALEVTQVQSMETAVASLAGAATVVVIAGEDKAASVP